MSKNNLCVRVVDDRPLHIYINSDKFTSDGDNTICLSYDEENVAYWIKLNGNNVEKGLDEVMGLLGRDTRNWWHKDIVLHWGVNTWKFYNEFNIDDYDKEVYDEFGIDPYDYDNLH